MSRSEKEEEEAVVEQKCGKKRQREQTPDLEHLSYQLQGENEALKRCKQEFTKRTTQPCSSCQVIGTVRRMQQSR
jgi:hypothetical protein